MNECNIAERLTVALKDIVNLFFAVAEIDTLPYAVYDIRILPIRNKQGIYKYQGDVKIAVVSATFDEVDTISKQVDTAVNIMIKNSTDLIIKDDAAETTSPEGSQWITLLEYTIIQLI